MIEQDFIGRLEKSVEVSKSIHKDFSEASKLFSDREVEGAQKRLSKGADALTTFMQWYVLVLQSQTTSSYASVIAVLDEKFIEPLEEVFNSLSSSEALQSSTALGDILRSRLLPMLGELTVFTEAVLDKALEAKED